MRRRGGWPTARIAASASTRWTPRVTRVSVTARCVVTPSCVMDSTLYSMPATYACTRTRGSRLPIVRFTHPADGLGGRSGFGRVGCHAVDGEHGANTATARVGGDLRRRSPLPPVRAGRDRCAPARPAAPSTRSCRQRIRPGVVARWTAWPRAAATFVRAPDSGPAASSIGLQGLDQSGALCVDQDRVLVGREDVEVDVGAGENQVLVVVDGEGPGSDSGGTMYRQERSGSGIRSRMPACRAWNTPGRRRAPSSQCGCPPCAHTRWTRQSWPRCR